MSQERGQAAELDAQFAGFTAMPWWEGERDGELERGIASFFETDMGRRLSRAAAEDPASVEREATFSLKWPVIDLPRWLPGLRTAMEVDPRWSSPEWQRALRESWVLIQGRIDCIFRTAEGWIILDWKSDRVGSGELVDRAKSYSTQIAIYREAAARLWGPVAGARLVFVQSGSCVTPADRIS